MRVLFKGIFGSRLYGLSTPKSDTDYKGIFMPDPKDIILQRVEKTINNNTKLNPNIKNCADDVDYSLYSLGYYIRLCLMGDVETIDMLHTPKSMWLETSPEWEYLHANRKLFYSKKVTSFLRYAQNQCAKYGIKGSRLNDSRKVSNYLKSLNSYKKLSEVWDTLPTGDNISTYMLKNAHQEDKRCYEVCGRKLMATSPIDKAIEVMDAFIARYGARAEEAARNENIDWKAVSHAYRSVYQILEVLETGDLQYPLKDRKHLLDLKLGNLHYKNDKVGEKLSELIEHVTSLAEASNLRDEPDTSHWESVLSVMYYQEIMKLPDLGQI